jgi:hypothetical protein
MTSIRDGGPGRRGEGWSSASLLWICPIFGLLAGTIVLGLFGLTPWTAIAVVLLIACPLAALGLLHPMIGVIAMTVSSLSVIANSLLLKRAQLEIHRP